MEYPVFQKRFGVVMGCVVGVILLFGVYKAVFSAPRSFPQDSIVSVRSGAGLLELSEELETEGVIRSPLLFRMVAILLGGERGMRAGEYYLEKPQGVFTMARRIVRGEHDIETVRITIPEGFTAKKISALFDNERFPFFDNEAFEEEAPEGYLFPDTYFIPITATASSTADILGDNFIRKIFPVMPEIEESGRTLEEIITMASLLEGEAKTSEDMAVVSGILWKRLEAGMPLQVDTSFVYILGKSSEDLTLEDLRVESPYNSYQNTGLPPTPISNPGLVSIMAAANPTSTPYLYFLTGDDGEMYYARTFDEHVANKKKYLSQE